VPQKRHYVGMDIKPIEKYVLTFAKDAEGEDVLFSFILTLSKPISKVQENLNKHVLSLPGIDNFSAFGMYSMEIRTARTFDPEEIVQQIKENLEKHVLSDIIRPKIVT
jgi:hypothetical protein